METGTILAPPNDNKQTNLVKALMVEEHYRNIVQCKKIILNVISAMMINRSNWISIYQSMVLELLCNKMDFLSYPVDIQVSSEYLTEFLL